MTVFLSLDKVDTVPVINTGIDKQLMLWLGVLVDVLNADLTRLEDAINTFAAPSYTALEISNFAPGDVIDGMIFYDSTNNEYVGMQAGSLVKFTTTPYP